MTEKQKHFEGIAVSGGVVFGKVFCLDPRKLTVDPRPLPESKIEDEIKRF